MRAGAADSPHPRLHERRFVLVPLAEIAPECDPSGPGRSRRASCSRAAPTAREVLSAAPWPAAAPCEVPATSRSRAPSAWARRRWSSAWPSGSTRNTVLEEWEQNPFLTAFYDGSRGAAFQAELFFLLSRYRQQQELVQRTLFSQLTLADYVFEKSKLFAYLNLDDSELLIYEKLYGLLAESRAPARPRRLPAGAHRGPAERIRARGRRRRAALSEEYLAEVNRAYNHYFFHYTQTPLLVVNTAEVDFVQSDDDLDDLMKQIQGMSKGTQYYVPPDLFDLAPGLVHACFRPMSIANEKRQLPLRFEEAPPGTRPSSRRRSPASRAARFG